MTAGLSSPHALPQGTVDWGLARSSFAETGAGGGAFQFDALTLGVVLRPLRRHVARYGDTRSRDVPLLPGTGWLLPANVDGECAWDQASAFLNLSIPTSTLAQVAGGSGVPDFDPRYAFDDPTATRIALELHAARGDDAVARMYRETMTLALAAHLLRAMHAAPMPATGAGVPDPRLARAAALVEERLAAPLTLDDLARCAAMSPFHFARAFKAAYGLAPHQYLATRRIERAKDLLRATRLPLAEIVERVGYSNASHFGAAFRKATGTTPARFRGG